MTPDDRMYTRTHEWIRIEDDDAVVGISEYAQDALGDITYIELPETGTEVTAGTEFGVIESVKAASDLFAPVDGTVSEVNTALNDSPELVNQDPYEDGWIVKLAGVTEEDLEGLLTAQQYAAQLDKNKE